MAAEDVPGIDDGLDEEPFVKKEKKKPVHEDLRFALNINSLMDIMTILLVFILVSVTSDPLSIKQDDFLMLAKSTADFKPVDSIPVTMTKNAIVVDHKNIVKVDCTTPTGQVCQDDDYKSEGNFYKIDKSFKEDGSESSFLVEPLFKKLDEMVKIQKQENKELGREFKGIITIILDKEIPFRMIAELVHTAGMAGLSDLRFAIIKRGFR